MSTRATLWSARADAILADGEWHDGLTVAREAEKAIPPGIAERRAERNRVLSSEARNGQPRDRIVERPVARLITIGRKSMIQALFSARMREGAWEVDVPIPEDGWRTGGWRIRDKRVGRDTLLGLARRFHISKEAVRQLVLRDPPVEHYTEGTWTYVTDLAAFTERVAEYRRESRQRRSVASREVHARRAAQERTAHPLGELAKLTNIAPETARKICDDNPELPWEHKGRASYLPKTELPAWEKAVRAWREAGHVRRSEASKAVRARTRRPPQTEEGP